MAVLLSQLELARGNPAASSEALARAQRETVRAIPLGDVQAIPEIKTLGDTAVSKSVNALTARGRLPRRLGLVAAATLVLAVGGLYGWGRLRQSTLHEEVTKPVAVATPAPPPAPVEPAVVEMGLDSTPRGAEVFVGGALLGTTPARYKSAPTSEPVEFVFRLSGHESQQIRALPAQGLTVTAKFSTPAPIPAPAPTATPARAPARASTASKSRHPSKPPTPSAEDIQTER
jgi:hypothetical protein